MTNHLTRERGAVVSGLCSTWAWPHPSPLPPVFYFYFLAGKLILPSQQPLILMCDLSRSKTVSSQRVTTAHSPKLSPYLLFVGRENVPFGNLEDYNSLFSKHYVSRQCVSSKLWEHLTQSGFVTLSWGVGRLQWSVVNRSLVTQKSFCCFRCWRESPGNIEYFSRGGFWVAFLSLCKAMLWAWLMSTSCSPLVQTPQGFLALVSQQGIYVLYEECRTKSRALWKSVMFYFIKT